MPQAWAVGWEAEDAIGSIAAASEPTDQVEIVTGDRDLLQLVRDPKVRVLFTLKGVTQLGDFDEAGVMEKYGVPADRYAEFATLRGDHSDGLPGVKGIGEKTARELVRAYPSIDAMLEQARAVRRDPGPLATSMSLRAKLVDGADYLATMRDVVPIRQDLPVVWNRPAADPDRLDEVAERNGVGGPARRLRAALAGARTEGPGGR
jgi:5'-3' exonuclease